MEELQSNTDKEMIIEKASQEAVSDLSDTTKCWGECSTEEKLERLRLELKNVQANVHWFFLILHHTHGANDDIYIPLRNVRREYYSRNDLKDDDYF